MAVTVNKETVVLGGLVNEGWVDGNGVMTFTGLGAGTYTITELVAHDGYNLLKSPVTVEITWEDSNENMWKVTATAIGVNGDAETVDATLTGGMYAFDVVNQPGVELPSTGGMGTSLFYFAGTMLVLIACVLLVTKKRMANAA